MSNKEELADFIETTYEELNNPLLTDKQRMLKLGEMVLYLSRMFLD
jgi:hypothetical protein